VVGEHLLSLTTRSTRPILTHYSETSSVAQRGALDVFRAYGVVAPAAPPASTAPAVPESTLDGSPGTLADA
jgi:hypothetical protein